MEGRGDPRLSLSRGHPLMWQGWEEARAGQGPQAVCVDRPGVNLTVGEKGTRRGRGGVVRFLGSKFPEAWDISTVSDPVSSSGREEALFSWEPIMGR